MALQGSSTKSNYLRESIRVKKHDVLYVDHDFQPNNQSLTGGKYKPEWSSFIWKRPTELKEGSWDVFEGKIEPMDIKQGVLGDCYLLAVLSALSERPNRIKDLFVSQHFEKLGIYALKINVMGEWTECVIDDFIPCYKNFKQRGACFTRAHGNELWVVLLEKVWAKTFGSYLQIESGFTREAMHAFTGAPTRTFFNEKKNYEHAWEALLQGEKYNYVMTCGSGDQEGGKKHDGHVQGYGDTGLVSRHAYSVLRAKVVRSQGRQVRLVQLRNPWGSKEWKGDWGDKSYKWTPQLRKELDVTDADDGTFWMAYDDFALYMTDFQLCYVHDDYKYVEIKSKCAHNQVKQFKLSIPSYGTYFINVNQKSKRHFPAGAYKYSTVRLVVGKDLKNGKFEYIGSWMNADQECWVKMKNVQAGDYVVHVACEWYQKNQRPFVLTSYGRGKAKFLPLPENKDFLEKVFCDRGRKMPKDKRKDFKKDNEPNTYQIITFDDAYGFFYINNLQGGSAMECNLTFRKMKGLAYLPPYRGNTALLKVGKQTEGCVLISKTLPYECQYVQSTVFKRSESDLKKLAKKEGSAQQYKKGNTVVCTLYQYQHGDGIFYYYENVSRKHTITLNVVYELKNLRIAKGGRGMKADINLSPGQNHSVDLRTTGGQWNLGSSVSYSIK